MGYFAFIVVADKGTPPWDYRPVKSLPSESPYANYEKNPLPTSLIVEQTVNMSDDELFFFISYGGKKAPALASSMSVESRNVVIQYIRFKQKPAL